MIRHSGPVRSCQRWWIRVPVPNSKLGGGGGSVPCRSLATGSPCRDPQVIFISTGAAVSRSATRNPDEVSAGIALGHPPQDESGGSIVLRCGFPIAVGFE
jgi:hypothetical protein